MHAHAPEVLADLVARLRAGSAAAGHPLYRRPPPKDLIAANEGSQVHQLDRADLEILLATSTRCPPLEFDRWATEVLCGQVRPGEVPA